MSEFDLIRRHLTGLGRRRTDVLVDVGDDCALLQVPAGRELAATTDTLVSGVHFFPDCDPEALGWKSLAVNLSDLAAVGADAAWVTLALTLPDADEAWLSAFAGGFADLAESAGVRLVGGDLTRGPLSITVQAHGLVPAGKALRRGGARPGDLICVSGTLGDAGLALRQMTSGGAVDASMRRRLERPTPRLRLGAALRDVASSAIDLSDGLLSDLGHILAASDAGAEIERERLPLSGTLSAALIEESDWRLPLASGDDYELCFTLPPALEARLPALAEAGACDLAVIGSIVPAPGLRVLRPDGSEWTPDGRGFDHFQA
jgi:thiamine-monophosphate kinase